MLDRMFFVASILMLYGCSDTDGQPYEADSVGRRVQTCLSAITNGCNRVDYEREKQKAFEIVSGFPEDSSKRKILTEIATRFIAMELRVNDEDYQSYEIAVTRYKRFANELFQQLRGYVNDDERLELSMRNWQKYKQLCFCITMGQRRDDESVNTFFQRKMCAMNLFTYYNNDIMRLRKYMSSQRISGLNSHLHERLIREGKDLLEYPSREDMLRSFRSSAPQNDKSR